MDAGIGFRNRDEAARGGFFKQERPTPTGEPMGLIVPVGRTTTGDDRRAFRKRVARRRNRKEYA